jgi:hypothetical protein
MTAPDANLPSADPERHRARPYLMHSDAAAPFRAGQRHRANKKMTAPDANLPSADPERHRARPYLIHPDAAAPFRAGQRHRANKKMTVPDDSVVFLGVGTSDKQVLVAFYVSAQI